ncbi:MAG: LysR family transcriptional regulator [Tepidiformaceae bacterium]
MRIEQLLTFKRVADERSYTRAAEKEFLTQPSVYSQVRQMETECGAKLFYVAGKEVLLTAAGKDLYRLADTVAGAYQEFLSGSRNRADARMHAVRIAALSYFGVLAEATEQLRNEDPQCVVNFESLHPTEATDMIRAGAVDFGFFGDSYVLEGLVKE